MSSTNELSPAIAVFQHLAGADGSPSNAMLQNVATETLGMSMHNAVTAQQQAQMIGNASTTTSLSKLLNISNVTNIETKNNQEEAHTNSVVCTWEGLARFASASGASQDFDLSGTFRCQFEPIPGQDQLVKWTIESNLVGKVTLDQVIPDARLQFTGLGFEALPDRVKIPSFPRCSLQVSGSILTGLAGDSSKMRVGDLHGVALIADVDEVVDSGGKAIQKKATLSLTLHLPDEFAKKNTLELNGPLQITG